MKNAATLSRIRRRIIATERAKALGKRSRDPRLLILEREASRWKAEQEEARQGKAAQRRRAEILKKQRP